MASFIFSFFFVFCCSFFLMSLSSSWVIEWTFFSSSLNDLSAVFIFDVFSLMFFFTVTLISCVIFIYCQYYMDTEKSMLKFLILLLFFVFSMIFLIFSPNLFFLLLGWDGLGVTSYLLVIYYMNYSSSVAGMVTFLTNRLGDVFFFLSLSLFYLFMDWNFYEHKVYFYFLSVLLILTFVTKSAQIPFSSWLPAAMAAPTPVSSLVHSSTLVTAGVYLLIRFYVLLSPYCSFLMVSSVFTVIMAGIMANLDWDLKKIVAYSTLSQLGFMVTSLSCGLVVYSFFHLLTHAFFKASLFMCTGVVIHSSDNSQDFRNSSFFGPMTPVLSLASMVCLLCLCGFPFSSGFFSKDIVLDGAVPSFLFFFFFFCGVVLTFCYSFRFGFYVFFNLSVRNKMFIVSESMYWVLYSILFLLMFALVFGWFWVETVFMFTGMAIVSLGWKLFYWLSLLFFLFSSFFFLNDFFSYFRKYFLSSLWGLFSVVSTRFFYPFFSFSFSVVRFLDFGWFESLLGPSSVLLLFFNFSFWKLFSFVFFFNSIIFFFLLVL